MLFTFGKRCIMADAMNEIPLGATAPWPDDNMHMIDYDDNQGLDFAPSISFGTILINISIMKSILLGEISDPALGYSGVGLIDFLIFDQ